MNAQTAISSSGHEAGGSGGTASTTIGQVFCNTNIDVLTGSVAEGVQQPYEISVVTEASDGEKFFLEVESYPNPVSDYLILKVKVNGAAQCLASLYDINGTLLTVMEIKENETHISVTGFIPGTYFLKVMSNNKLIKTFKIIKY